MALAHAPVYQEVYRFLASAPSHEAILAFRPTPATQARIRDLLERSQAGELSQDEQAELNEFEQVEHFMRILICIRANSVVISPKALPLLYPPMFP